AKVKKLGPPEEVFAKVVTNAYFRQANATAAKLADSKDKDKHSALAIQAKEEMQIARATAWALIYYLAKNQKLEHLMRYCEETATLPRALEFDDRVLQGIFERSFQLRDRAAARGFAQAWFDEMQNITLEFPEMERELTNALMPWIAPERPQGPPGGPMGP